MQARPLGSRQGAVRHLLNEDVPEGIAVAFVGADEVAVGKALAELADLPAVAAFERGHARGAERSPEDAAQLDGSPLVRRQQVEAREHGRLHRVG